MVGKGAKVKKENIRFATLRLVVYGLYLILFLSLFSHIRTILCVIFLNISLNKHSRISPDGRNRWFISCRSVSCYYLHFWTLTCGLYLGCPHYPSYTEFLPDQLPFCSQARKSENYDISWKDLTSLLRSQTIYWIFPGITSWLGNLLQSLEKSRCDFSPAGFVLSAPKRGRCFKKIDSLTSRWYTVLFFLPSRVHTFSS